MRYLSQYLRDQGFELTTDPGADYSLHYVMSYGKRGMYKSLTRGIPIVTKLDGLGVHPHLNKHWRVFVEPMIRFQQMTTFTIYPSEFCLKAWRFAGRDRINNPYEIIYNGARADIFHVKPELQKEGSPHTILLHQNYLRDDGGLATVFKAFPQVVERLPDTKLILGGRLSGPIPGLVDSFLQAYPPGIRERVHVIGPTTHSTLPDLLNSADVFLHPDPVNASPHSVFEALACGLPVICYSGTGPSEFVRDGGIVLKSEYEPVNSGFERWPDQDPGQLAEAIIEVLENKAEYKARARAQASSYNSDLTCERYVQIFRYLLENPPPPVSRASAVRLVSRFYYSVFRANMLRSYQTRFGQK